MHISTLHLIVVLFFLAVVVTWASPTNDRKNQNTASASAQALRRQAVSLPEEPSGFRKFVRFQSEKLINVLFPDSPKTAAPAAPSKFCPAILNPVALDVSAFNDRFTLNPLSNANAIGLVTVKMPQDSQSRMGNGFFIGKLGFFLTTADLISSARDARYASIEVTPHYASSEEEKQRNIITYRRFISITFVYASKIKNFALVQVLDAVSLQREYTVASESIGIAGMPLEQASPKASDLAKLLNHPIYLPYGPGTDILINPAFTLPRIFHKTADEFHTAFSNGQKRAPVAAEITSFVKNDIFYMSKFFVDKPGIPIISQYTHEVMGMHVSKGCGQPQSDGMISYQGLSIQTIIKEVRRHIPDIEIPFTSSDLTKMLAKELVMSNQQIPRNRPVSPKKNAISPRKRAPSPRNRPVSPESKPVSPKNKPVSPIAKPVSPKTKPVSPKMQQQQPQPVLRPLQPRHPESYDGEYEIIPLDDSPRHNKQEDIASDDEYDFINPSDFKEKLPEVFRNSDQYEIKNNYIPKF